MKEFTIRDCQEAEYARLWASMEVLPVEVKNAPLDACFDELRKLFFNGAIVYKAFSYDPDIIPGCTDSDPFLIAFFKLESVMKALGLSDFDDYYAKEERLFDFKSPLSFPCSFAQDIKSGGAYVSSSLPVLTIRDMAIQAVDTMIDGEYDNVTYYVSYKYWSSFFSDVFDATWVLFHPNKKLVHVIISRESDL